MGKVVSRRLYWPGLQVVTVLFCNLLKFSMSLDKQQVSTVNVGKSFSLLYRKICLKRPLKNRQNKDLNNKW